VLISTRKHLQRVTKDDNSNGSANACQSDALGLNRGVGDILVMGDLLSDTSLHGALDVRMYSRGQGYNHVVFSGMRPAVLV
jgi:predicted nicotinamide N-methyase